VLDREISARRPWHLRRRSADIFIGAACLDTGEKTAKGFHEAEILDHQLSNSLGMDLLRSCLVTTPLDLVDISSSQSSIVTYNRFLEYQLDPPNRPCNLFCMLLSGVAAAEFLQPVAGLQGEKKRTANLLPKCLCWWHRF
jgi:hypothetical protein